MKTSLRPHHCAFRITPNSLEFVLELFRQLGCELHYRKPQARWAMVKHPDSEIILQINEKNQKPEIAEEKNYSHIAFITDDPQEELTRLKKWIEGQGKKFVEGGWSDRERYFDCSDIFIDFVIEIMHKSVAEED